MKNTEHHISDEHLNAFIDGQLDSNEQNHLFSLLNEDEIVAQRICELRNTNEMIQFAYHNPPHASNRRKQRRQGNPLMGGIAATVLVTLGFISGKLYYAQQASDTTPLADNIYYSDEQLDTLDQNVIVHLDSSSPQKLIGTLQKAEAILNHYKASGLNHSVEIITNNEGLNLLRTDTSHYANQIQSLMDNFQNVSFIACARAISRFQSRGIDVELLPNTDIAPSALDKIIKRLDKGWAYIKI